MKLVDPTLVCLALTPFPVTHLLPITLKATRSLLKPHPSQREFPIKPCCNPREQPVALSWMMPVLFKTRWTSEASIERKQRWSEMPTWEGINLPYLLQGQMPQGDDGISLAVENSGLNVPSRTLVPEVYTYWQGLRWLLVAVFILLTESIPLKETSIMDFSPKE